jgi:hypothetical protein
MASRYLRCLNRKYLGALMAIGTSASFAQAQPVDFACPRPGTIEERGAFKTQYTGPSPTDPYLCNGLDSWGKPQALLFNFFRPTDIQGTDVRAGMLDLLASRKTSVSFTFASGSAETWKMLRHEQVTFAGKKIDTIVIDQERERFPSSRRPFHGHYTHWLDPRDGLWVKADLNVISGETAMERKPFQDSAITLP